MKFRRMMIDGKGNVHQPGQIVPEGFSSPLGIAEMIKVGDIEDDPKMPQKEFDYLDVPTLNEPEPIEQPKIEINQEPIQEPVKLEIATHKKRGRKAGK